MRTALTFAAIATLLLSSGCEELENEVQKRPAADSDNTYDTGAPLMPKAAQDAHCANPEDYEADAVRWVDADRHLGAVYGTPTRGELVVFLHGSHQTPDHHLNLLSTAAYAGFRVVGVQTPTRPRGAGNCSDDFPDDYEACRADSSRGRVYGSEHADYYTLLDEDSVVARIHEALVELDAVQPNDGWDRYFETMPADAYDHERYLNWDRIVISGFSGGALNATVLAIDEAMHGAVTVSGPNEEFSWIEPGETPVDAWWVIHHREENMAEERANNFDTLGFETLDTPVSPLPETMNGQAWPPYRGAHRLVSDIEASADCTSEGPHGSMANDVCMNTEEGLSSDPFALFRPYLYAYCSAGNADINDASGERT